MNVIRVLPEKVASQIAAGEVIDRPASVVRELVDNSIDAGADRIVITIERGGRGLVKVADNGMGMSRDDLLLSVERHATSKIETASDIFSVESLGFRGEALPSIAAVSRMQIVTRPKEAVAGHRLTIAGGKFNAIEESGAPVGTVVQVRDLFFNIPARRKFLRTAKTEMGHIVDSLSRVALAHGTIGFKLDSEGKTVLNLPAEDHRFSRLAFLMGRKAAESVMEAEAASSGLSIEVHAAPPGFSRSRGDRLYVYVNRRPIRDRIMNKAILEGYGRRLMKGQFPQAAVFIDMDPSRVDVNVHPTKQEVRFRDANDVFKAVSSTIEKALARTTAAFVDPAPLTTVPPSPSPGPYPRLHPLEGPAGVSEPMEAYVRHGEDPRASEWAAPREQVTIRETPQVIGQLGNTYILCQTKEGLLLVDQHAAHERVLYEALKKGFASSQLESQVLLMPHRLELSLKEKATALEKGEQFARLGMELDHFGGTTFLLRSHPAILQNVAWDSFLSELLAALEQGEVEQEDILDKVLALMACHGAIRAGHSLTREEMVLLLGQLEATELPTNCPHGRPISKRFSYYDIEKMFKRVV